MNPFTVKTFPVPIDESLAFQLKELRKTSFATNPISDSEPSEEEHADRYWGHKDMFMEVVVFEGDEIIGACRVLKREILFQSQNIVLGGIGGVCTRPDKRGLGVASAHLAVAMEKLFETGCDIAYLCTALTNPEKVHLYQKFGFQIMGRDHTYVGESGKRYTDDDAMIAPVRSQEIFKQVMSAKEQFDIGLGNW